MCRIYEDVTHYSYPERDEKVHCETKYKDPIILGTVRRNTKILNIFISTTINKKKSDVTKFL